LCRGRTAAFGHDDVGPRRALLLEPARTVVRGCGGHDQQGKQWMRSFHHYKPLPPL